jgi:hypothetical protein
MGVPTPGTPTYANTAAYDSSAGEAGSGAHQLVPVPLPVGSVRASLGALSTFEDCYALVRFLGTTFKDFQVNDQDMLTGVKMVSVLLGCVWLRVARQRWVRYALVRFLGTTFKDFQVNDQDMLTGVKMVSVLGMLTVLLGTVIKGDL